MSLSIEFVAYGTPKGQPRVRAFVRGKHAGVYDPGTADNWKSTVRLAAKEAWDGRQFKGAVRLTVLAHLPRPAVHIRSNGTPKDWAPFYHTGKPDCDNIAKAIMDALTTIGIWEDDTQVACLVMSKTYVNPPTPAHAVIRIEEMLQ